MKPLAAAMLLLAVIAVLVAVSVKERAPQPNIPLVNAEAKTWREVWAAPPQFCTTPMPVHPQKRKVIA